MRRANRNNDELAGEPAEHDEADPSSALTTRRAVIAGAAAGLAGLVADSVISAQPASATNGNPVLLGATNWASATTAVNTTYGIGLDVAASGSRAVAVYGYSPNGTGVQGQTEAKGESGVSGLDLSTRGGHGIYGRSTNGIGAYGHSKTGTGVYAGSTSGHALKVVGKVAFSTSGLLTVAAGTTSVTVTLAGVTTTSIDLATLQGDAGAIAVANAIPATGSFTINLTAAPSSAVQVAWFVIG